MEKAIKKQMQPGLPFAERPDENSWKNRKGCHYCRTGAAVCNSLPGCQAPQRTSPAQTIQVKLGIYGGSQTLWRYMAYKKDEMLRPRGYEVSFTRYPTEGALQAAFLKKDIDVIATLPTDVPSFVEDGRQVQFFLPIAWVQEGYPLIYRC